MCSHKSLSGLTKIRDNIDAVSVRSSARFDSLDEQTQRIITALLDQRKAVSDEITVALTQLVSRLDAINDENHRQTRHMILEGRRRNAKPGDVFEITAGIEMLSVSEA